MRPRGRSPQSSTRREWFRLGVASLLASVAAAGTARGQIVVDNTLGRGGALTPGANGNFDIGANLGRTVGPNLFHSFEQFNVNTGQSATFSAPAASGIRHVLSRVTGPNASNVDGTIRSTIPGADLYLVNPNGVVFGKNARLDVPGSFTATTANSVRLRDGGRFRASNPSASALTAAPPSAFGFLTPAGATPPKAIAVRGSQLAVPASRAVSLIGGDVRVSGGAKVSAPAGRINVVSVASAGTVGFDPDTAAVSVPIGAGTGAFARLGRLEIVEGSVLDASNVLTDGTIIPGDNGGGPIILCGSEFTLDGRSQILSRSGGSSRGSGVVAFFTGEATLLDRSTIDVSSLEGSTAKAGRVTLTAAQITMDRGEGAAGPSIFADTSDRVSAILLPPTGTVGLPPGVFVFTGAAGPGAVNLTTTTGDLTLGSGTFINADSSGEVAAGEINLQTPANLRIMGGSSVSSDASGSGDAGAINLNAGNISLDDASVSSRTQGVGNAGSIILKAPSGIALTRGATLATTTSGSGNGGAIQLSSPEGQVNVAGDISADAASGSTGTGGEVRIASRNLVVTGSITTDTGGSGAGGRITLDLSGDLQVSPPEDFIPPPFSENNYRFGAVRAGTEGLGAGGLISVRANHVTLANSGNISVNVGVKATGAGGDISVHAAGSIFVVDNGFISADTFGGNPDGFYDPGAVPITGGRAGTVNVTAADITVGYRGFISSNVRGTGSGGNVFVTASGSLLVQDEGVISSDVFNSGVPGVQRSPGGSVDVRAGDLTVTGVGSAISTDTSGFGAGGALSVTTSGPLRVLAGGSISADTSGPYAGISTGGQLAIQAPGVLISGPGSRVSTQTTGPGDAGALTLVANDLMVTDRAQLTANTIGADRSNAPAGAGGDVFLDVAGSAQFTDRGSVSATTRGQGAGGSIAARIGGDARFAGGGAIRADSGGIGPSGSVTVNIGGTAEFMDSGSTISAGGTGGGGDVVLNVAGTARFASGSSVSANNVGPGRGGSVNVFVGGPLTLTSGAGFRATSVGTGEAGSIAVTTPHSISLRDGATVSVNARQAAGADPDLVVGANGGGIRLAAGGRLTLGGNSAVEALADGNAGDIRLQAGPGTIIELSDGSRVTASARAGSGGSVEIGRSEFLVVRNATITASAAGTGQGGRITNESPVFASTGPGFIPRQVSESLVDPNFRPFDEQGLSNVFNVQSAAGASGVVVTAAPSNTLASSLTPLTTRAPNLLVLAQYPASAAQEAAAKETARKYLARLGTTDGGPAAGSETTPPPSDATPPVGSVPTVSRPAATRPRPAPVPVVAARSRERGPQPGRVIAVEVPRREGSNAAAAVVLIDPVTKVVKSDVYEIAKRPLAGEDVPLGSVSATFVSSGGSSGSSPLGLLQP